MPLEKQHIAKLLSWVAESRADEIGCDECLGGMAEFAEAELVGRELPAALQQIRAHVGSCPECAEEYELLVELLETTGDAAV